MKIAPTVTGPLLPFNTIGQSETEAALQVLRGATLSGFLGGELQGGIHVRRLEEAWKTQFDVTHAIACNSATSGLLAACRAVGVAQGDGVVVSPFTMSATTAVPAFLGADIKFVDIEPEFFCLDPVLAFGAMTPTTKAIIATNLFGHPAELKTLAKIAHRAGAFLIEDNAQSPFAMEEGTYAGTIGDIGIFSLNVHKALQCGEGGMIVTDNDEFAEAMRLFINHGEMAGASVGLNLRMTEICAAISYAQLKKAKFIMGKRIAQAEQLIETLSPILEGPKTRDGCRHVYYCVPFKPPNGIKKEAIIYGLAAEGVPLRSGYLPPLYNLPAFHNSKTKCPVSESAETAMVLWENCAYDLSEINFRQFREAAIKVAKRKYAGG